ncbi:hypothetical protein GCM10023174_04110 [Chelativorans composti]|jgi:Protein of unknown function (DUF1344).|uniref:DUF1344 domain-containing protein n=1 Tax=Chelativorans composti TaxID=768533 RepID=A0ABW5DF41_9HYPH
MRLPALILGTALIGFSFAASAADTEGRITAVDPENMTITLSDGSTYKLPPEMDMSGLSQGDQVVIAYQVDKSGVRQITDLFIPE